ncbi:protein disulfide-isomerase A6-like [Mizuhopecten yessoensis]|uniref:protein disulfide-isomerase n=1 Tax=Mizuhopecten yessoensis TaxID=6573 RepID=A0A210QSG8_MIZYE|nr:protein disulfide-isomerase A6-like [Mizuhopecten yessoensis]OWF51690.1 Protein disulfide-isomerase A6 [Mizuhopecten yessoensis]
MQVLVLIMAGLLSKAAALYSSGDGVVQLTPANFDKEVMNSDELWIIEFYAPWCGHCKSLAPEWKKAAKALKGVVKIAAVDADAHGQLGGRFSVQGFPTIKVFGVNKNKPEDYQGGRTADAIVNAAMSKVKAMVNDRMSGRGGGSGGSGGGSKSGDPKDVIELTDGNFQELVLESDDLWLVEFFAPWCGHCKNLAPEWQSAASQMKGKVKFGAVDATVHTVYASRYEVRGYPTIKMFQKGEVREYDGGRTASDIVAWATDKAAANIPPPEVYQLTSEDVMKQNCQKQQICVFAVLPHILDCQADCRNNYISTLKRLGEKFKKNQWGWVWAEAAAQPEIEKALGMGGFGYPAMVALNSRKNLYVILKGPFSENGINEFLRDLSYGKGSSVPMRDNALPKVQTMEPWDGKDGQMYEEEEIDLSDVELDDLKEEL